LDIDHVGIEYFFYLAQMDANLLCILLSYSWCIKHWGLYKETSCLLWGIRSIEHHRLKLILIQVVHNFVLDVTLPLCTSSHKGLLDIPVLLLHFHFMLLLKFDIKRS